MTGRLKLEDLPEHLQKQVLAQLAPPPPPVEEQAKPTKQDVKLERELQRLCEQWLTLHGYHRLTYCAVMAPSVKNGESCGFFGHWSVSQGNPIMPDLFVCDLSMSRCVMIELKIAERYQPGQREYIEAGKWKKAKTLDEFVGIINAWRASW